MKGKKKNQFTYLPKNQVTKLVQLDAMKEVVWVVRMRVQVMKKEKHFLSQLKNMWRRQNVHNFILLKPHTVNAACQMLCYHEKEIPRNDLVH